LNKKSLITLTIIFFAIISLFAAVCAVYADYEPAGDESATFVSVAPDALIVLDLSGSMLFNPAGADNYIYGSSSSCVADTTNCTAGSSGGCAARGGHTGPDPGPGPGGGGVIPGGTIGDCSGGYCKSAVTNCNIDCSRLAIAQRALFNVLDNDDNDIINNADSDSLGIRIGYMNFSNCSSDDTGNSYSSGCNKLVTTISALGSQTGTSYSLTYCGSSSSCASSVIGCSGSASCIAGASATGGTPLATSLKEAKQYLDAHKASDPSAACRKKFVILVTDGADTYACGGDGSECQNHQYQRRREVVAAAKALYNAGYKVFVIGFGSSMPSYLQNTLNWMAYYGGTDNPFLTNSGSTSAYNIAFDSTSTYPTGITSCMADTNESASCYSSGTATDTSHFMASSNDPGYLPLSGYAFLAGDSDELTSALKNTMNTIRSATYSFTRASIQTIRTKDENYLYEASFWPSDIDPLWIGHLCRYQIDSAGVVADSPDWDAGTVLKNTTEGYRNIYTTDSLVSTGVLKTFSTSNLTNASLGVSTDAERTAIINFIRGGELDSSYTYYAWKLGDIFHTSPLSISTPNSNYFDQNDTSTTAAYTSFSNNHVRTVANGKKIILAGANDGQLHAFKALDGSEIWSFIPPNLLTGLKTISHSSHPTSLTHSYFIDGPLSAFEIWLGTGGTIGSSAKSASDWHTYLVIGEGRGGIDTLWSTSTACDSNFSPAYKNYSGGMFVPYGNYCGYYAFDISDTSAAPVFKWRLGGSIPISTASTGSAAYLGQAWSKMNMGKVRINNSEKWVGFIGAGYSGTNCAGTTTCDTRGKGFFAVDLSNGTILWQYTHGDNENMNYDLAGDAALVDYDGDGFLDTAYIGDIGGNVWRFKFCLAGNGISCNTSSWSGALLLANATPASGNKAIYTSPVVTFDTNFNLWVYVGTGNKTDPTGNSGTERLMAIKDSDRSTTYWLSNLTNISLTTYTDSSSGHGWYMNLHGTGEKILNPPVIHDKKIYFSTYIPATASTTCALTGTADLYIIDYLTGAGLYSGGVRSAGIGTGIPSSPVISRNPYTKKYDVYVSTSENTSASGGGSNSSGGLSIGKSATGLKNDPSSGNTSSKTLRYGRILGYNKYIKRSPTKLLDIKIISFYRSQNNKSGFVAHE
jgi:Tfp pilus tip-associated adhesin PilY1